MKKSIRIRKRKEGSERGKKETREKTKVREEAG
jgi:hypothetical protein